MNTFLNDSPKKTTCYFGRGIYKRRLNHFSKHTNFKTYNHELTLVQSTEKQNPWIPESCIHHLFDFMGMTIENLNTLRLISKKIGETAYNYFLMDFQKQVCSSSYDSYHSETFWSNNFLFTNSCEMIEASKHEQCIHFIRNYISLKHFFTTQIVSNADYKFSDPMEHMLFKYGNDSIEMPDHYREFIASKKTDESGFSMELNYNSMFCKLIECFLEIESYSACIKLCQMILKCYNPIAIYARLIQCNCLQKLGHYKEFFHCTLDCLKLCYDPSDIGQCFFNLGLYYMHYNITTKAVCFFLKSAEMSPSIKCVRYLDHIEHQYIIPKIKSIQETKEIVGFISEDHEKEMRHWNNMTTICRDYKKKLIGFLCDNNLIKLDLNMLKFLSNPPVDIITEVSPVTLFVGEPHMSELCRISKTSESTLLETKTVDQKASMNEQQKDSSFLKSYPENEMSSFLKTYQDFIFETDSNLFFKNFDSKTMKTIKDNTQKSEPIISHKIEGWDYECGINKKIKLYLNMIYEIEQNNKIKKPLEYEFWINSKTEKKESNQTREQFIEFGKVWLFRCFNESRNTLHLIKSLK